MNVSCSLHVTQTQRARTPLEVTNVLATVVTAGMANSHVTVRYIFDFETFYFSNLLLRYRWVYRGDSRVRVCTLRRHWRIVRLQLLLRIHLIRRSAQMRRRWWMRNRWHRLSHQGHVYQHSGQLCVHVQSWLRWKRTQMYQQIHLLVLWISSTQIATLFYACFFPITLTLDYC